ESCGIDATIVVPFDMEFAKISARDFVKVLLVEKIGIKAIVVGYDYRFGNGREGNIDFLRKMGEEYDFQVDVVSGLQIADSVVSSTAIRHLIKDGELKEANRLLGRCYEIRGEVIPGRQRGGRLLGFPTANLSLNSLAQPKPGVYAVRVEIEGKRYGGAANLGYNPTFGGEALSLETFIFDFDQDIYGKTITVTFVDRLRDETKFPGIEALMEQIRKDVEKAKTVLAEADRLGVCKTG
ncbi:MAG: bifunctional riboflavin kinase/FAD synthetase, partial [Acidobacteriota bacterium]